MPLRRERAFRCLLPATCLPAARCHCTRLRRDARVSLLLGAAADVHSRERFGPRLVLETGPPLSWLLWLRAAAPSTSLLGLTPCRHSRACLSPRPAPWPARTRPLLGLPLITRSLRSSIGVCVLRRSPRLPASSSGRQRRPFAPRRQGLPPACVSGGRSCGRALSLLALAPPHAPRRCRAARCALCCAGVRTAVVARVGGRVPWFHLLCAPLWWVAVCTRAGFSWVARFGACSAQGRQRLCWGWGWWVPPLGG